MCTATPYDCIKHRINVTIGEKRCVHRFTRSKLRFRRIVLQKRLRWKYLQESRKLFVDQTYFVCQSVCGLVAICQGPKVAECFNFARVFRQLPPMIKRFLRSCSAAFISSSIVLMSGCHSYSTHSGVLPSSRVNGMVYYLPRGKIRIKGSYDAPAQVEVSPFTVVITEEYEADPGAKFYLKPDTNYFYDDDTHLAVNEKGLLTTANATSEDKSPQIIQDAAQAFASGAKFAAGMPFGAFAIPDLALPQPRQPFDISFTLQEAQSDMGLARINSTLKRAGFRLHKPVVVERTTLSFAKSSLAPSETPDTHSSTHGVVFRPLFAVRLKLDDSPAREEERGRRSILKRGVAADAKIAETSLQQAEQDLKTAEASLAEAIKGNLPELEINSRRTKQLAAKNAVGLAEQNRDKAVINIDRAGLGNSGRVIEIVRTVALPDESQALTFQYSRLLFVKKVSTVGFIDGILRDVQSVRPSPIAGFMAIPKNVLGILAPLPLDVKTAKKDNLQAVKDINSLRVPVVPAAAAP
jgi:hypothetical protein